MGYTVIKNLRKFDHIAEAMKDFHWLKIPEHNQYKVLVTIYQCVNSLTPSFLIDLPDLNLTRRNLRSDTHGKLPIPWNKYITVQSDKLDQDYKMICHKI